MTPTVFVLIGILNGYPVAMSDIPNREICDKMAYALATAGVDHKQCLPVPDQDHD